MYLEINKYTKVIGGEKVLADVKVGMESGKIYGLKGKNGSGKTMLMRAICGLIKPSEGEVKVDGKIIGKDISFPESIGAYIENTGFIGNYSAFDNLRILADIKEITSDEQIIKVLTMVGLGSAGKKKYKKFSLGMKQKLGIASAIMENPDIIVLDEPTNALDEQSIKVLRDILEEHKKRGALLIIASHDKEELEYLADEIFVIDAGHVTDEIIIDRGREINEA